MSVDLDTTEGRKQYLSDKLDDLLDGINDSYGTVLMEELLSRLELTIRDFNDEMQILCSQLVKKQEERQQLLEMLKSREVMSTKVENQKSLISDDNSPLDIQSSEVSNQATHSIVKQSDEGIPAWEKKLAKLEKK